MRISTLCLAGCCVILSPPAELSCRPPLLPLWVATAVVATTMGRARYPVGGEEATKALPPPPPPPACTVTCTKSGAVLICVVAADAPTLGGLLQACGAALLPVPRTGLDGAFTDHILSHYSLLKRPEQFVVAATAAPAAAHARPVTAATSSRQPPASSLHSQPATAAAGCMQLSVARP